MKQMTNNLLGTLALLLCSGLAFAQNSEGVGIDGLPVEPDDEKCYAKCVTEEVWKDSTFQVLKKPAYKVLEIVPAEYKTVEETYVSKEASKKYTYIPATYKTVYDTVVVKEAYNELTIIPVEFKDEIETIEIKQAGGKWVAGEKSPDCESVDPADCRVLHYRKYPAEYAYIPTEVLEKPETTESKLIRQVTKVVPRQVIDQPARVEEEDIPEETKTIEREVLVKDETVVEKEIPAVYEDVTKQVLVQKGGMTVWREVPCELEPIAEIIPIYYELGNANLTPVSKQIIDTKLYTLLVNDPDVRIELRSHTDSRGDAGSNMRLSQRRAESVVNYLVDKGIEATRLEARGYGETKLLNNCKDGVSCSEEQHQANRRTEFRIIN